eukprot:m.1568 g.1568  ORF g.1568 m.1568 type:complete len:238 (+) comp7245_c0_seq1:338-1051(+)
MNRSLTAISLLTVIFSLALQCHLSETRPIECHPFYTKTFAVLYAGNMKEYMLSVNDNRQRHLGLIKVNGSNSGENAPKRARFNICRHSLSEASYDEIKVFFQSQQSHKSCLGIDSMGKMVQRPNFECKNTAFLWVENISSLLPLDCKKCSVLCGSSVRKNRRQSWLTGVHLYESHKSRKAFNMADFPEACSSKSKFEEAVIKAEYSSACHLSGDMPLREAISKVAIYIEKLPSQTVL